MYINETHSTSTLLRELYNEELPHLYYIRTDYQTAGRGQTGNSWESEEGKNLLFSALLRYNNIRATEQWRLSMLVAVALWEVLANYLPQEQLSIKWPNDIYYKEDKIAGILIEGHCSCQYAATRVGETNHVQIALQYAILARCAVDGDIGEVKAVLNSVVGVRKVILIDLCPLAIAHFGFPICTA